MQPVTASTLILTRNASPNKPAWSRTEYRGDYIEGERNDCAVRALMTVTGSTYREAHAAIQQATGRRNGKGTPTYPLTMMLDDRKGLLGCTFERVVGDRGPAGTFIKGYPAPKAGTLARFIRENPVGVFYVCKSGHAFAIVDGVLVDTWHVGSRSKVTAAWRVTKAAPKRTHHPAQLRALLVTGKTCAEAAEACGVSIDRARAAEQALRDLGLLG